MAGMAAAPLRPSPCRWACPTTTSWRHSPHPTRWGSMTRPVYQPGVRFDSAGAGGWLCVVGAPVAKYIRPGEGQIHSPSGGGYLPLGSSVVAAGRQQLADGSALPPGYIRQPEYRLCEPRFLRSTALSGVRVFAQDYFGAGIFPLRNQDKG